MKHAIGAIAALTLAAVGVIMTEDSAKGVDKIVIPHTACPTEDSTFCVWDARHRGNGKGKSFLSLKDGTVIYIRHRWAHKLTH